MIAVRFWCGTEPTSRVIQCAEYLLEKDSPPSLSKTVLPISPLNKPWFTLASHSSIENDGTDTITLYNKQQSKAEFLAAWQGIEAVVPVVHRYSPAVLFMAQPPSPIPTTRLYRPPLLGTCDHPLITPMMSAAIWHAAESALGTPYDAAGIAAVIGYIITHHQESFWGDGKARFYCAEGDVDWMRQGGYEPFPHDHRPGDNVTPAAYEYALISLGWTLDSDLSTP